jgi:hypothetical protein
MEQWVSDIYKSAIAKHKEYGLNDGMAVFYSPVIYKPKILFIGDNPGGGKEEKGEVHTEPPIHNYYLNVDYKLAKIMRERIFCSDKLFPFLENSVITNRVFFQSEDMDHLIKAGIWKDMEKWCLPHVKRIIEKIDPEMIFAESITSYKRLIYDLKGKFGPVLVPDNGLGLMHSGKVGDKMLLGIKHPTGGRQRISYENWGLVSEKLGEIL